MKICVPIKESAQKAVERGLMKASEKADLAEIWLDQIKDLDLKKLLSEAPLPLLCAVKRKVEKGSFEGSYEEQAELLIEAMRNKARYIDVPLYMPEKLNKKIVHEQKKYSRTRIIVSHHDFEATPAIAEMMKIAEECRSRGAHVVKIATQANDLQDALHVLSVGQVLEAQKTPHILIGMGLEGRLTRILTPTMGGEMMFAVLDRKKATAPGQMTVDELRSAWKLLKK